MATSFKAKIRKRRASGFHSVYILCTHNDKPVYIRTDLVVQDSGVTDKGDITDPRVLMRASAIICTYYDRLQGKRIDNLTAKEVVEIATDSAVEDIPFASFAEAYIRKLSERGVARYGLTYAFQHRHRYSGCAFGLPLHILYVPQILGYLVCYALPRV